MNTKQSIINIEAKQLGVKLGSDDRKLLISKFETTESNLSHLFSGKRKAKFGKAAKIIAFSKKLAAINEQKAALV